ncbi:manganese efflux pump MntP family protein [Halonatronum saccharophilum]|uniref:manganese efflux pump MntP n=1 Tax=Halonatronum saccharophilum TaxID=150060 RepID=UPI0004856445|nr:manganese efflux pump [Halonatronum saccharophilum]
MGRIELLALGIALGTDAFSIAMAIGVRRIGLILIIKLSLLIGALHIIMPLLGMGVGYVLHTFFGSYYFEGTIDNIASLLGAGILMILGMVMVYESLSSKDICDLEFSLRGWPLLVLALSVSIDALSVGFTLGILNSSVIISSFILGLITTFMVILGLFIGNKVGCLLKGRAEVLGGVTLILLGIHLMVSSI